MIFLNRSEIFQSLDHRLSHKLFFAYILPNNSSVVLLCCLTQPDSKFHDCMALWLFLIAANKKTNLWGTTSPTYLCQFLSLLCSRCTVTCDCFSCCGTRKEMCFRKEEVRLWHLPGNNEPGIPLTISLCSTVKTFKLFSWCPNMSHD